MVDQPTQCNELSTAAETMVGFLLVDGAVEMLVQIQQCFEAFGTEIAFIALALIVPRGGRGSRRLIRCAAMILDQAVGEKMIAVNLAAIVVNLLAIDSR